MRAVQRALRAVAEDDAAARFLRNDPASLARALELPDADISAMRSADTFFESEKPILDRPLEGGRSARQRRAAGGAFVAAEVPASTLVVTADTGTLLPGPDTGTFTLSATATPSTVTPSTVTTQPQPPVGPPPDAPRPPQPPVPRPPEATTPPAPVGPASQAATVPVAVSGGCCGTAALSALVASVSTTAVTAITAIGAIAQQPATRDCRHHGQPRHSEEQR